MVIFIDVTIPELGENFEAVLELYPIRWGLLGLQKPHA